MKERGGMASMPQDKHSQKKQGELGHESKLKYASEMGNPADLDRANEGLANYAKKHKMKY